MKMQQKMLSQISRKKVKYLAINAIGIVGLVIAIIVILFTQDQAELLSQIGEGFSHSPVGLMISSIKSMF